MISPYTSSYFAATDSWNAVRLGKELMSKPVDEEEEGPAAEDDEEKIVACLEK